MTTELVTAHAGKNHVDSEDVGALYAGALGSGRFAFDVGEGLAVTMTDANTVRIGTGVFLMDGRQVRVKEAESVKVANGSQGAFRRDLVTYTYKRDPSNGNVEDGAWSVLQGTAAASEEEAKAPEYVAGSILDGDLTATVAVAEVSLSGLTPTAKLLLPSVASLKTLGDSVSRKQVRLDNSLMCYVEGGICIISTDFLALPVSNSLRRIGVLPNGLKPLGHTASNKADSDDIAYIATLRYRGDDSKYGQLMVNNSGEISVWVNSGSPDNAYYFGILVFPVTSS